MPIAFLKPTGQTDAGPNIATGALTDVDEGVSGADGAVEVSVGKQWVTPFFIEWALENLPGDATSINSVIIRVRSRIVGTWVDDSIQYIWTIVGTNVAHPLLQWDFEADGGAGLANRQQTVTDSPSVANVDAALIRVTQAYSASMSKEAITHDPDCFELEVDYETGGDIVLVVQDSDHLNVADNIDLVQANVLAVNDADHLHDAENIVLDVGADVSLRSSSGVHNSSIDTIVVAEPAGAIVGDWLVVVVNGNTDTTLSDDNGATPFTKDNQVNNAPSGNTVAIFSRRKESGDPATLSFSSAAGAQRMSAIAMAFKDGDPTVLYDVAPTAATSDQDPGPIGSFDCKDITTLADKAIHVAVSCLDSGASLFNLFPATYVEVETKDGEGQGLSIYIKTITPAGATGAQTFGTSGSVAWMSQSFSISPVVAGTLLVVDDADHLHTGDNLDLVQANVLVVQDSDHLHDADLLALIQANVLVVADSDHLHDAENIVLGTGIELIVNDADHLHDAELLALIQANVLALQDSDHLNVADNVALVQANVLAMNDSDHLHDAENLELTVSVALVIADSDHLHDAELIDLVQANVLAVAEAFSAHVADNLDLIQANVLAMQDADHLHDAENLVLDVSTTLILNDADHLHTGDNLDLLQANVLAIADADHLHDAELIALIQANVLAVDDADHLHDAENVVLTVDVSLIVDDSDHLHTGDNVDLIQAAILAIDDVFHDNIADNVVLSSGLTLIMSDAVHQVVSDNINLFDPLGTLPEGIVFTIDGKDRVFVINTKNRVFVVLPSNRV